MAGKVNGIAIGMIGIGGFFCYAGVKGYSVTAAIQSVVQGKSPVTLSNQYPIGTPTGSSGNTGGSSGSSGKAGSGPVTPANQAQSYAFSQFSKYGWGTDQESDLVKLWTKESGWSEIATNQGSGAYGIAQALPSSKYPPAGQPSAPNGTAKMQAQIDWGLQYIKGRYGNPAGAWAHEVANNWY